mmetsp:Transcript_19341/g.23093  ORF Transcript_19341/g.23093 Transcript_19341/m.23093 type:complete len:313 (-) Transcript_19341:582-1520(-)|eukprot:CAMPEP_0197847708 /NCGR_PEP_ID=MMETSP1438-20131217/6869_1 /TAXON_ID=1461541 /ORGANISM="Pterosperma sp., Strain CCMP1384" /LENGTH=312 /DNA_ID=CAMNT_0043459713 /DNA_START=53 /DNA_END=991 /DNA_ORIENTATION=+
MGAKNSSPKGIDANQTGAYDGKQFSEKEVADKVVEQYNEAHARTFYKYVMGGGGMDIHFGIFRKPTDGVYEASKHTNARMLQMLDWANPITKDSHVLDLGSGHGGISHEILQKYGCNVTSYNIAPDQNADNAAEAKRLGVDAKQTIVQGNFNDGLPKEWKDKFSHVISCEVFCHAASQQALLKEIHSCMAPGGALVFSDIMGADGADEKALKGFTDRNATSKMSRPSQYRDYMIKAGFVSTGWYDGSQHLEHYFRGMLKQIHDNKSAMMAEGVPEGYLGNWSASLTERAEIQESKGVFAWGIFEGRKKGPAF